MNLTIRFWLIVCLLFTSSATFAQTRHIRVEATPNDKTQFLNLVRSNMDVVHVHGSHLEMLVSDVELEKLRAEGIGTRIIDPNVYGPFPVLGGNWLPEYLSYSEVETQLNSLVASYPNLTELVIIGTSIEGRNIYALKISDNAASDEDEAEILLIGNHHAREVITPIICMHVAEKLLTGYGSDPTYTDWVDNREIWIVPVLNPDGYVYVETVDLFWRKNRRDNPGDDEGVDLNRNWGFEWGHDNNGSSGNYGSQVYRGKGPFSEPETDALQQFVGTREFTVAMTFHSYGNLLLWGPGYKPIDGPDQDVFAGFGNVVAAQNNYTLGNPAAGTIYLTNGDATDWLYHAAGIIAFTPEVGSGQDFFNPTANRIPVLVQEGSICAWEAIRYGDRLGQLAPPGQPLVNEIGFSTGDYTITWDAPIDADTEVVAYELLEKTGPVVAVDGAEDGDVNFDLGGWTVSSDRSVKGAFSFYGGSEDRLNNICLSKEGYVVQPGDAFTFDAWFDIESEWDYAYAILSTDGGRSYAALQGSFTTMDDPNGRNSDHGITGNSNGWQPLSFDLSDYVGQTVWLGFRYSTDRGTLGDGIWIDNVWPIQTWTSSTVIDSDITETQYSISDRPAGTYFYTMRGLDGEGEWGYPSAYTSATVDDQFVVLPSNFLVTRGTHVSGGIAELAESDDQYLVFDPEFLTFRYQLEFTADATSPSAAPSELEFSYESRTFNLVGTVDQEIELFNYDWGQFETMDTRLASASATDTLVSVTPVGDPARFVQPGTNAVLARISYQNSLPFWVFDTQNLYIPYRVSADHIFWTITP